MTSKEKAEMRKLDLQLQKNPVAIIGMASIFPQAKTLPEYWDNILKKIDCITEVPSSRWNIQDYYDPDPSAPDKTYCKRGAFIPDIDFDPMEFGLPPNILEVTDVSQLISLVVARDALEDAGYSEGKDFDHENTGVILGVVGMSTKLFIPLMSRLQYPVWEKVLRSSGVSESDTQKLIEKMKLAYVGWEENSFPGTIGNVIAGRIANRFDLGGTNCVVDAACGSSLAAARMAVSELIERRANLMITGGVDTDNSIGSFMCFSKTPAFSKSEHVRPFDAESDGMMVGEGIGMLVLKRLDDAERDQDRIYAVIRGFGSSSDGRYKSIYAPRADGQARAMRRAYAEAGYSAASVGLLEAHGTGTMAGDPTEVQSMKIVFNESNAGNQSVALGSVKSQIAHTKATAGTASMIKVAMALHQKVLPATINVTQPNPKLDLENSAFYLNTETRPWIRTRKDMPRRAGLSSFGFGGTNFHVTLEEYEPEHRSAYRRNTVPQTILFAAENNTELLAQAETALRQLQSEQAQQTYLSLAAASRELTIPSDQPRLGFVAGNLEEAVQLLTAAVTTLKDKPNEESWENPKGISYRLRGIDASGKVVALFPGQGSQYVNMGRDAALNFPPVREAFSAMDELFARTGRKPLSLTVYPVPVFDAKQTENQVEALQQTENAQPAIGTLSVGLYNLLKEAGLHPDYAAGHSFGELTALWAAGVLSEVDYMTLAKARGEAMARPDNTDFDPGTMLAVKGDAVQIKEELNAFPEITLANWNSNNQVVLAGAKAEIARVQQALTDKGYSVVQLPVSAAFHTPLVGHAQKPFAKVIASTKFNKPATPVFSNSTGEAYPIEPKAIQAILEDHILKPVLFKNEIENIYTHGGSIFIEIGPKNVLTNLVNNILADKPHFAFAINANQKKDSDRQVRELNMQLRVLGLNLKHIDPYAVDTKPAPAKKKSPVSVVLNGGLYMTEKTRSAFTKSLNDGFKVSLPASQGPASQAPVPVAPAPVETPVPAVTTANMQPVPAPIASPASTFTGGPAAVLAVEQILSQFNNQQSEALHVHQQYLQNESEYTRTFSQLTQLELGMLTNGNAQQAEQAVAALQSLERSMMRFHDHQTETLRIHEQYLKDQTAFAQEMLKLVEKSPNTALPFAVQAQVAAVPQTAPATTQLAAVPLPVSNNGNGHHPIQTETAAVIARPAAAPVTPVAPSAPAAASPVVPAPARPAGINTDQVKTALLNVVSEKTGYPVEMLELDMDMEADLGIDSIKRVEILGAIQSQFPELPHLESDAMSEMRTLGHIVARLGSAVPASPASTAVMAVEPVRAVQAAAPAADAALVKDALLAVVSEKTGYPVEMLELDMDMEADLGIDSIKRVEILGAMQAQFPDLPKLGADSLADLRTLGHIVNQLNAGQLASAPVAEAPASAPEDAPAPTVEPKTAPVQAAPQQQSGESLELIQKALLEVVSEKTGYPVEMLELEMDMEADLGIDSIKRVEILGAMQERFPHLPKPGADAIGELRTLGQILEFMGGESSPLAQPVDTQKESTGEGAAIPAEMVEEVLTSPIHRGVVNLKALPQPDALKANFPTGHVCLLTDDGSSATGLLAASLTNMGIPVTVLSYPDSVVSASPPMPEGIRRIVLNDLSEEQLQQSLANVTRQGPVSLFIHMERSWSSGADNAENEKAVAKYVFLLAKHLKEDLNQAAKNGRAAFLTVVRMDGTFGLGGSSNFSAVSGSLFGLVKSLNLEWDDVFCRAIDISPEISPEQAVNCILAELSDPNRLITEVGYTNEGRSTLVVEQPVNEVKA